MQLIRSFFVLMLMSAAFADTVTMQDGRVFEGIFLGATARQIRMEIGGRTETFNVADVAMIQFLAPSPAPAAAAPSYARPAAGAYAPAPAAAGLVLPAGTRFVVRMIDAVDSDRNRTGDSFRGSMDEPVYINGQQVVPRGADVVLRLVDSKESGKIAGRSTLTMNLQSVLMNGRMVDINTQSVTQASGSRGARTAKMGLGGAGIGAAIGAIAGGGTGAAIGAGAGGAAGVGAEVLTKGQRVRIPSEARLTFVLDVAVGI